MIECAEDAEGNRWNRSSHCKRCLEVSPRGKFVYLRDPERPEEVVKVLTEEFRSFLKGAKEGEFDGI